MKINQAIRLIKSHLTDDLRQPRYRGHPNPLRGHCYVAAEALYHLVGGRPHSLRMGDEVHWYLVLDGRVIDPTVSQFKSLPDYSSGRGRGFLTKQPSRRAQKVLDRISEKRCQQ